MANHTYGGAVTGVLDTAGNWDTIPDAVQGVLIFDAVQNAPAGYADGTPPATAMTIDGTWGLSLLGGADLALSDILGDLANQVVVDVTLAGEAAYVHDSTEAITGNVTLNTSTMDVTANAAIGGTLSLTSSYYTHTSTSAITGAVTASDTTAYVAGANHALTGGITLTSSLLNLLNHAITGDVDLAGGTITMTTLGGGILGAVTDSAGSNTIALGTDGNITGSCDLGDCTWTGVGTLTVNTAGALNLGGAAVGLTIDIATAGTVTAGSNISAKTILLSGGEYAAAVTHTLADNQTIIVDDGPTTLTLTDAGVHVRIVGAAFTCTLGGALSCKTLSIGPTTTLDADSNSLTLASGRITGYGTLTNLTPAGIIHVAPGVIDGGGNDGNVIFDPVQREIVV